ncbi:hypothetical protein ACEN9Z_00195, partial [Stenotrophomonas geniculata]
MNTAGNAAEHGSALQGGKPVIDFTGRRVLIAGGSKGIGREMAPAMSTRRPVIDFTGLPPCR